MGLKRIEIFKNEFRSRIKKKNWNCYLKILKIRISVGGRIKKVKIKKILAAL